MTARPNNKYMVDVLEGRSGKWVVERFTVPKESFQGFSSRCVPAGTYTRLMRGETVVMSDTPDEIRDCLLPIHKAHGRCLVAGLGLGMVARAMLLKDEVEHVTIIEQSPNVIALMGPWLKERFRDRVEIIYADIMTWTPPKGARYAVAWFDIWDNICSDNLEEMKTLTRRFGRRAAWKGSWSREMCEMQKRQELQLFYPC